MSLPLGGPWVPTWERRLDLAGGEEAVRPFPFQLCQVEVIVEIKSFIKLSMKLPLKKHHLRRVR